MYIIWNIWNTRIMTRIFSNMKWHGLLESLPDMCLWATPRTPVQSLHVISHTTYTSVSKNKWHWPLLLKLTLSYNLDLCGSYSFLTMLYYFYLLNKHCLKFNWPSFSLFLYIFYYQNSSDLLKNYILHEYQFDKIWI